MICCEIRIVKCQFHSCENGTCMGFIDCVDPRGTNSLPSKMTKMKKDSLWNCDELNVHYQQCNAPKLLSKQSSDGRQFAIPWVLEIYCNFLITNRNVFHALIYTLPSYYSIVQMITAGDCKLNLFEEPTLPRWSLRCCQGVWYIVKGCFLTGVSGHLVTATANWLSTYPKLR